MKRTLYLVGILTLIFYANAFGQLNLPRDSQRAEVAQIIGDTRVSLVYHRPNVKGRKVWGELVPYGQVWRTGANENTTFETSKDVKINGQTLPAGKYGLHTIPNQNEWTIIFNKVNNEWGSFKYDVKQDALRVTAKPLATADFRETMWIGLENIKANTADVIIAWENARVPFTIDVGDVNVRTLAEIRKTMPNLKAEDFRTAQAATNWILANKLSAGYEEARGWLDAALKIRETYGLLSTKANLLAAMGKNQEAIATGEKALQMGKAATPPANTSDLEKLLTKLKMEK